MLLPMPSHSSCNVTVMLRYIRLSVALIQRGADPTIVDFDGNYPSDYVGTDFECRPIIDAHLNKLGKSGLCEN